MEEPQEAKYGSWKSPITSEAIVSTNIKFGEIRVDGENVYWSEGRPTEGGRNVIVKWGSESSCDITPDAPWNVRTRVHEYGGGAFQVVDSDLYFSNFSDQRIYHQKDGSSPVAVTPADVPLRYADACVDKHRNMLICVREDHSSGEHGEPVNTIVAINLKADSLDPGTVLVSGSDFYSSPRLSPDGKYLAYLSWNHPQMPWDGTHLWVSELDERGHCGTPSLVAGGASESICQPEWSPDGAWLYFVSDRTDWWNIYRVPAPDASLPSAAAAAEPVLPRAAEFASPHWTFARSQYAFADAGTLVCTFSEGGGPRLALVDTATLRAEDHALPFATASDLRVAAGHAVLLAGLPDEAPRVVRLHLARREPATLRRGDAGGGGGAAALAGYVSRAQHVEFPCGGGGGGGSGEGVVVGHAYYYPPTNPRYRAPAGERPPLLVKAHGGPTAAASPSYQAGVQYWTSRGIAVCDVDYRGSSGYGRAYRARLLGAWGEADVDDCCAAAASLAARGLADPARLCIEGGSAGGLTVLGALARRAGAFRCGASHYGVADLEALARDTHKFEARYLDGLVGPYPAQADLYRERSPLTHAAGLSQPVIFFQGNQDRVVPPAQAEAMVEALRAGGVPVAYLLFEGEQHGFRRAENIRRALDAQLYFFSKVLGFTAADEIEPVEIENFKN